MQKGKRAARRWGLGRRVVVVERATEGKRKRLTHGALALDRVLLPGSNKAFFFLKK